MLTLEELEAVDAFRAAILCPDIAESGPRITATLCPVTRDHPHYRRPRDHSAAGLFVGGPDEAHSALATLMPEKPAPRITPPSPADAKAEMSRRAKRTLAMYERRRKELEELRARRAEAVRRNG